MDQMPPEILNKILGYIPTYHTVSAWNSALEPGRVSSRSDVYRSSSTVITYHPTHKCRPDMLALRLVCRSFRDAKVVVDCYESYVKDVEKRREYARRDREERKMKKEGKMKGERGAMRTRGWDASTRGPYRPRGGVFTGNIGAVAPTSPRLAAALRERLRAIREERVARGRGGGLRGGVFGHGGRRGGVGQPRGGPINSTSTPWNGQGPAPRFEGASETLFRGGSVNTSMGHDVFGTGATDDARARMIAAARAAERARDTDEPRKGGE